MIFSPDVFLIHGWAVNHHIFDGLQKTLAIAAPNWHTPDLPGHGAAPLTHDFNIETIADQFAQQIRQPTHLIGWSLGGMIALVMAARYPDKIKTLCLTATLAKLYASSDYPQGLTHTVLNRMIPRFKQNYQQSISQFLNLQMLHATQQDRQRTLDLLPALCQYGAPSDLSRALTALEQADLRALLPEIHTPTLLIFGGRDVITPARMGEYLHQHISFSQYLLLPQAAHAPFLSHTHQFTQALNDFWEQYT